jgi:hypothetical protein
MECNVQWEMPCWYRNVAVQYGMALVPYDAGDMTWDMTSIVKNLHNKGFDGQFAVIGLMFYNSYLSCNTKKLLASHCTFPILI